MTTRCPYRHISYSRWRYQTFQWLFTASGSPSPASPCLTQPRPAVSYCRQVTFTSLRSVLARDNETHKLQEGPGRAVAGDEKAFGCLQDNINQANRTEKALSQGEQDLLLGAEQLPQVDETNVLHRPFYIQHEGSEYSGPQDGVVTPEKRQGRKTKQPSRRHQSRQWSPYGEQGKHDLKALAASLEESLDSLAIPEEVEREVPSQVKPSEVLPVSPLVLALERKKPTKLSPRDMGKEELANNPWATMLASPMRMCSATGVRLPKDLLVPWGLVRNPATNEIYFMPTELAELDSLKDKRKISKPSGSAVLKATVIAEECAPGLKSDSSAWQITEDVDSDTEKSKGDWSVSHLENKHTEAKTRLNGSHLASQNSKSSSPWPKPSIVYMIPFLPLLHHLTLRFTVIQRDLFTRRSKPNALNSILPYRLKAVIDRAKFYAEQQPKISPSSTLNEMTNPALPSSFQDVKWEANIHKVMLRILRERLLTTLEMVANRNQKLWRQERELIKAIRARNDSSGDSKERNWTLVRCKGQDQLAPERGHGPDVNGAGICILVEPSVTNTPTSRQEMDMKPNQGNEDDTAQAPSHASYSPTDSYAATNASWGDFSKLEPSTIEIDQYTSFPLFSLNDLLDADHISRFRYLSANTGVLAPRQSAPDDSHGNAYILIIPANAFGAKAVIEEVWRLWRFLGATHA